MGANGSERHGTPAAQLPFDFRHRPVHGHDDLVAGERLNAAIAMIDRWPDWPTGAVVLAGPAGSGKTHLADIWRNRSGATVLDPGCLDADALAAAAGGPGLIEDIDRREFDETQLFHLLNTVRQHATTLLITARAWPATWPVRLADLVSRLRACALMEIGEPDDGLLAQLIEKLFADRQMAVDPKVTAFLVRRMERSFRAAQDIVDRLDRLALARKTRISRALAGEAIAARETAGCGRGDD